MMTTAASPAPRRCALTEFLSAQECKELQYIHKSCGVFGYRPFVLSTTLSHLVATNCAQLIIPFLSVRERIKEAVEEYFGREYELFVEFTGLISWTKGANIGWHSDDNRSYLRQRHYADCCRESVNELLSVEAVCYLNTYEEDFEGGLFHFQEGEPSTIIPSLGTLIIYTADGRNMHRVDEVTEGERCTLALWFTSDRGHDEDQKLIQQISLTVPDLEARLSDGEPEKVSDTLPSKQTIRPLAASSVMYKAYNLHNGSDQAVVEGNARRGLANPYFNTSIDLRVVRLALMGFSCRFSSTAVDEDPDDSPVVLTYKHKDVPHLFSSSLEALQVAEFHQFRKATLSKLSAVASEQQLGDPKKWNSTKSDPVDSTESRRKTDSCTAAVNEAWVASLEADQDDLLNFLTSVGQFEAYTSTLWAKLLQLFPTWKTTGSLTSYDE